MIAMIRRTPDSPEERVKLLFHHVPFYNDYENLDENGDPTKKILHPLVIDHGRGRESVVLIKGHTICELVTAVEKGADGEWPEEEVIASATAWCSASDTYSREKGRHESLAELLRTCSLPGPSKGAIADAYRLRKIRAAKVP